ncbi:MAG: hypothetical protein ACYS47_21855, partial [Planctomycetota bacterium]
MRHAPLFFVLLFLSACARAPAGGAGGMDRKTTVMQAFEERLPGAQDIPAEERFAGCGVPGLFAERYTVIDMFLHRWWDWSRVDMDGGAEGEWKALMSQVRLHENVLRAGGFFPVMAYGQSRPVEPRGKARDRMWRIQVKAAMRYGGVDNDGGDDETYAIDPRAERWVHWRTYAHEESGAACTIRLELARKDRILFAEFFLTERG